MRYAHFYEEEISVVQEFIPVFDLKEKMWWKI